MKVKDKYRANVILHRWKADYNLIADAVSDFGFSGAVINVPFGDGFTGNKKNLEEFKKIISALNNCSLEYWIYDENGYPSGMANGAALKGECDLSAKGLYMRKFEAFLTPVRFAYHIDGVSDFIYCAFRCRLDLSDVCEARILYDTAEAVPCENGKVDIDLNPGEACYVFIVKNAYEGSHCVHNISSRKKYINLLSDAATDAFIRQAYIPIRDEAPNAFPGSRAVFTDEPSLMTAYARESETYNYALIPFEESLFSAFEREYGYSAKNLLPLLFESTDSRCYRLRRDFYRLVGKTIARVYTGKLNDFCKESGTVLSGHYLAEERIADHVINYGNFVGVLMESGYPGMDILQVTPEDFFWNAPKFLQMIARKKGTDGFMVELCPFFNKEIFDKDPFENIMGALSILFMYGARKINTYFLPALCEYDPVALAGYQGSMGRKESVYFNEYIGRIGTLLEDLRCVNDTYVYYAIEDVQAKFVPSVCGRYAQDKQLSGLDDCLTGLAECLLKKGAEYAFCDAEDLSGDFRAKRVVVPEADFISAETKENLRKAELRGCDVVFLKRRPRAIGTGEEVTGIGRVLSFEELSGTELSEMAKRREITVPENVYLQHYEQGVLYVYNNCRKESLCTVWKDYVCYDPDSGCEKKVNAGETIGIRSFRAVILREY